MITVNTHTVMKSDSIGMFKNAELMSEYLNPEEYMQDRLSFNINNVKEMPQGCTKLLTQNSTSSSITL